MEYELVDSFGIDHEELAGLEPALVFCLGVEYQIFRQRLADCSHQFEEQIHAVNEARLADMCRRRGRVCQTGWIHDDHEEWRWMKVESA